MSKNVSVAGCTEDFWHVQSEKWASYNYQELIYAVLGLITI